MPRHTVVSAQQHQAALARYAHAHPLAVAHPELLCVPRVHVDVARRGDDAPAELHASGRSYWTRSRTGPR